MNTAPTIAPLISVALCTYNGAKYLREQLDSIIHQTYANLELVIVDDASTDATMEILKEYAEKEPRIQLHQNKINLGFNLNFQTAISYCTGEWIAIADQDDIWHQQKLEIMLQQWNQHSVLIHCSSKKFTVTREINDSQKTAVKAFNGSQLRHLAARNTVEGHNILFHQSLKEKAIPFKEELFYDWWLGAVAAVNGGVQWVDKILVWRRIHAENTYEKKMAPALDERKVWKQHLEAFISLPGLKEQDMLFMKQCLELLNQHASYQQWHRFIFQNRQNFFYFKKGIFAFISRWKNSEKLARKLAANA